jgi:hypothetical protein
MVRPNFRFNWMTIRRALAALMGMYYPRDKARWSVLPCAHCGGIPRDRLFGRLAWLAVAPKL